MRLVHLHCFVFIELTDFQSARPIMVGIDGAAQDEALWKEEIRLFTSNDEITLEYDDTIILTFTPTFPTIEILEADGEFIRNTATVFIIDNDCK